MPYDLIGGDYVDIGDEVDLVGADYSMVGADDLQSLLAAASGARANPRMAQFARAKLAANQTLVRSQSYEKTREYPIGFDSGTTLIAAGAQASITVRPQIPFRGERLVVPSDIAGSFTIDDIRVGKNSQFVATGSVPARTFQETGVGVRLSLDTCQVSMDLVLVATNISLASARFRATMIGRAVE